MLALKMLKIAYRTDLTMTNSRGPVMPGVYVSEQRIDEFVNGIFGANKKANKAAYKRGMAIAAAVFTYRKVRGK